MVKFYRIHKSDSFKVEKTQLFNLEAIDLIYVNKETHEDSLRLIQTQ